MDGGAGDGDVLRVESGGGDVTLLSTDRISGIETFEGGGRAVRGTTGANTLDFSDFIAVNNVAAIRGLAGADRITGGAGSDTIFGGSGNDALTGGRGNDAITGDIGADVFVFLGGDVSGADTVTDFDRSGNDVIRFLGFSFGSANPGGLSNQARLNAVAAATTFDGGGALIDLDDLGGSGDIRLAGVAALAFGSSEDFLFA